MRKIIPEKIYKDGGAVVIQLDGNRNVTAVTVKPESEKCGTITVKYAINGILSDLISYGEKKTDGGNEIEFTSEIPVSASHIFIFAENGDVGAEVFEDDEKSTAECYPAYKDFDLGENWYLDKITVSTSGSGYCRYSIYTSLNGSDFDFVARKNDGCDVFDAGEKEARIIRVYIEYNSASPYIPQIDIKFTGEKSNTPIQKRPEINIPDFEASEYNTVLTEKDTIEEVYGIVERRIGSRYKKWFSFEIAEHTCDYFELKESEGKVCITGNNGVSLACGLNHYLKYFCKVNISQTGDQVRMPSEVMLPEKPVFKETKAKIRYSYNYCTLSYSMAFWGENEWRDELDWLALNGVNVVLDATAQEEVWRRFLGSLGYTHDEIKKYIAGPAYYAWAYMANLFGYGGPVHDTWFEERTKLARKNQLIMRKLGMYPVLQGYSGMVPVDIELYDKEAVTVPQGTWCSFTRPSMLKTTDKAFKKYAALFYKAQKEVYGDYSKYFATDPFHEGGNTADMSPREISKEVLEAMLEANGDAVWIIQSWQQNPTSELLLGLSDVKNGREHALILDLYAEKLPNYDKGCANSAVYGYSKEFDNTPWVFCMLNNFGGRLGLHGHLDNLANRIPEAFNKCEKIAGIGITPEASVNNPVLYDFFFESVWQDSASEKMQEKDLNSWLHEYSMRRYGAKSESAEKAWDILKETVYKAELNNLGQGAPECVLNARPAEGISAASTWGNAVISYDKKELEKAAKLLLRDYALLKESKGYIYDVVTVLQQILSNKAQDCYDKMIECLKNKDINGFKISSDEFLKLADKMETVTGSSEYYMLGRWVEQAKALAENADDFSKKLYEFNAKALVTTWGAYNQAEVGQLHDYSNRQWAGLIGDFYKKRWQRWICTRKAELEGKPYEDKINWFEWEWSWAMSDTCYKTEPTATDLSELGKEILG